MSALTPSRFLVTGGAGFIGSSVVRRLLADGHSVRVFDNFATGRRENIAEVRDRIELIEGDLRSESDVRRAVEGVRFVLHLGALGSVARSVQDPMTTHEVNSTGTLRILLAARNAGVERVVFSSSSSVYGNTPTLPKRESMTPQPLSPYALSKLSGEHHCRLFHELYGLAAFSLRYFNVFGPRQNPRSQYAAVIPLFVDALRKGQSPVLHGDGLQTRDFTFVEDVVAANLCCCVAPREAAGKAYNVAWGNRISVLDLARKIAGLLGVAIEPVHADPRPGDVRDSQADSARAKESLGWEPRVPFDEGLRRTVEWFVANAP
ncbi:MAG: SDR family oxidoreductase [Verrucomicrobia bacterium]|nr:SDR family oxidoreductase [Kiritimatiellia bacterium]MCO6400982.1 SDR family oxidoreductase [Verrucomicrobiota bacterium]